MASHIRRAIGSVWQARRWIAVYSLLTAIVGLFGFLVAPSVGLGDGAAERLAGYPGVVWLIVLGVFLLWSAARSGGQHPAAAASE